MAARAGTSYIDFRADFSQLRRQIATEMQKLGHERIDIKADVDVDTRGFTTKVARARKQAEAQVAKPIVQTLAGDFDTSGFQRFAAANDQAERSARAKKIETRLGFDVDDSELARYRAIREKLQRDAGRQEAFKLRLGADFDRAAFTAFNREVDNSDRSLNRVTRSAAGTTTALGGLSLMARKTTGSFFSFGTRIPIVQIGVLGGVLYNAVGGVTSLVGALAPLSGLLGAIGPLATSAAQGIGTINLATAGVGDAIKSAFAEQDKAAVGSTASLSAAAGAAEGAREAALSLEAAERTQRFAIEDVARAREEGTRQIEDMRAAVRSLALEEEGATLGLKEAKQALNQLVAEGADQLEVDRALLSVKEARSELQKTRQEGKRARSDLGAVGAAGGVRGLPQVVQARRSLADANRGVAEAERELAAAAKRSTEALAGGGAAADAAAQKLAKLPPAAQQYVKFIVGLRPKVKQLQATAAAGLLPGVEKGIKSAMGNFPRLNKVIGGTAEALGKLAEKAGDRLGGPQWGKALEIQGKRNEVTITRLGTAGLHLAEMFRHVTLAAGPLVNSLTKWVVTLTDSWRESARLGRESGTLQAFFKDAGATFLKVDRIVRDLAVSFKNIGSAARQAFGNELLGNIKTGAANLREWTGSIQGQKEMVRVFGDIGDTLKRVGRFIEDLVQDFRRLKDEGNTAGQALSKIFIDVLEDLVTEAAQAGPRIALAFAKGWLKADWFGRIFGAAFLVQRFGGPAAWSAIGAKLGAALGIGVTTGAAGSVAASGGIAGVVGAAGGGTAAASTATAAGVATGAAAGGGLLAGLRQKITGSGISKSISPGLKAGGLGAALVFAEPFLQGVLEKIDRGFEGSVGDTLRKTLGDKLGSVVSAALKTFTPGGLIRAPKSLFNLGKDLFGFGEQKQEVSRQVQGLRDKVQALFGKGAKLKLDASIDPAAANRAIMLIETRIADLQNPFDKLGSNMKSVAKIAAAQLGRIGDILGFETKAGANAVQRNFKAVRQAIEDNLRSGRTSAVASLRGIRQAAIESSRAVRSTTAKNFGEARDFIRDAMKDSLVTSRQGHRMLRDLWFTEMAFYGFSKSEALNIRKARSGKPGVKNEFSPRGEPHRSGQRGGLVSDIASGVRNYASGGLVQFGKAGQTGPDNIPVQFGERKIVVGAGEVGAVFNRHQLPVLNARLADLGGLPGFFNQYDRKHSQARGGFAGKAKRFASGGIVALGRKLQREGYMVGEHPAFGGVSQNIGRKSTSYHHSGQAIDVNADNFPGGEGPALDRLYARLKRLAGVIELIWKGQGGSGHYDHLHVAMGGKGDLSGLPGMVAAKLAGVEVTGPDSARKAIVQRALDFARSGAQQTLDDAAASMSMEGAEPGVLGVGPKKGAASRSQMVRWARTALEQTAIFPASAENIEKILTLAMKESSWITDSINLWDSNAAAGNPSGGLMHITIDKVGGSYKRLYDPVDNIATSIRYQKSTYGDLVTHSPYAKGGLVDPAQMLAPGGLVQPLRKTLKKITKGATKKKRSKALDAFKRKIGKLGLPDKLQTAILGQLEQHEQFSDLATRAGGLSTTDPNTDVAQLAKVGNKNEGGWLVDDLSVLTALRNNLLKVRKIILERKAKLEAALKLAQERLKGLSKKGTTPRKWKGLDPAKDSIAKWNKQSGDKRQKRVKEWHKLHGSLPGDREFTKDGKLLVGPGRRKSALTNIVTSLKAQRNNLVDPDGSEGGLGTYGSSGGAGVLGTLFEVQGYPASGDLFKRWPMLPPLGEFGGHIGTAQQSLADLGESLRARSDSSATSDVSDSGRGDRLEELLRLERQRGLVRDIEVAELLRSARMPPFGGSFGQGGPVPGPVGAARTIIAHGGETVVPRDGQGGITYLIIQDGAVDPNKIRVIASDEAKVVVRREARSVGRTPGLAGSLKP